MIYNFSRLRINLLFSHGHILSQLTRVRLSHNNPIKFVVLVRVQITIYVQMEFNFVISWLVEYYEFMKN